MEMRGEEYKELGGGWAEGRAEGRERKKQDGATRLKMFV